MLVKTYLFWHCCYLISKCPRSKDLGVGQRQMMRRPLPVCSVAFLAPLALDLAIGQACSQPKESLFCVFYAFTSRRALVETLIGVDLFVSKHLVLVSLPALLSFCSCQKFRQVSLTDTSPPVGVSGAATTSSVSAAPTRFSRGVTTTLQSATAFCVHIQAYFLFHLHH